MSHVTMRSGYSEFVDRLNRFPQGAPPSETLYKILEVLVSEREARILAQLPIRPFTAPQAARLLKMSVAETRTTLDELAGRAVLVDTERDGETTYALPPPMAGFFEFSMMRTRGDVDQKLLGELFYQYLNVEEEFIKDLFVRGETQAGRVFVHEPVLTNENALHVLDYERASEVITSATHRGIGMCYCRHKMMHVGRSCDAPMDICMTFNGAASSLIRHGYAREVDTAEGLDLLQQAYEQNLVQFGENVREKVNFICNCCGCCCEAMIAARKFGLLNPVHTSNFMPTVDEAACNGCGRCVNVCPVGAMALVSANDPHDPKSRVARVDEDICLGCGVCVRACSQGALSLRSRPARVITPLNSTHRIIVMAIERGNLQDLVFDKRVLWNHRALAALLGVVLKLPPAKQALASRQMKSRYLEYLIARFAS
ncbi:MAG TPA: 4Fe-4S dicluster domain-containing protein [Coriobacteriia bacterium]|nr:4Fe-4S dicluster domain-containing protein [Coriobacteriia bacterium]